MNPINDRRNRAKRGSVLLILLGTIIVIGITLAAVLSLTVQEQRVLARTSAWNAALPSAEAGIEEAMAHLKQVGSGNRAANGWQAAGSESGTIYVMSRELSDSRYSVGISSATPPVIFSRGEYWCPSAERYISRTVLITTVGRVSYFKGLIAKRKISTGGHFSADSFDSLKPGLNLNGQYHASIRNDNGFVGTISSEPDAIEMGGQVKIYGSVATGPTGTVKTDSSASVGTANWVNGGNAGIEPNRYAKDMNVSFPDVSYNNNGPPPQPGVVGTNIYKYVLEDGVDYRLSTLVLSSGDTMLVRGKAKLLVDQDVSLSGSGSIQIEPNASLELYVKQSTVSITGSGIANKSGYAANFSLFGLPGLTTVNMTGNGSFLGTIYAPQARLRMAGGGADVMDFIGAGIFNVISGGGKFNFHYDESLGYISNDNFVITSWQEL